MNLNRNRTLWIVTLALLALIAVPLLAERGDDSERASKNGKTEGTIDGVELTLEFGRPKVKEREIWGGLVPWGQVWRTGADEATTITFSDDVTIEGEELPAGTYALFTIPTEDSWTIIFNKTAKQWGAFGYKEADDALRVEVEPKAAEHVEEMNFEIDGSQVVLRWAEVAVPFEVSSGS